MFRVQRSVPLQLWHPTKALPERLPKNVPEMAEEGGKSVQCCDLTQMLSNADLTAMLDGESLCCS